MPKDFNPFDPLGLFERKSDEPRGSGQRVQIPRGLAEQQAALLAMSKIAKMEALLDLLSELTGMSSTQVSQALIRDGISSWDAFVEGVLIRAEYFRSTGQVS